MVGEGSGGSYSEDFVEEAAVFVDKLFHEVALSASLGSFDEVN